MNVNFEIKRGEIWLGNLNDTKKEKTSKQQGIRPLLIIQNNVGNKYSPTVIVAVITGKTSKRPLPTHVEIDTDSGLTKPSLVLLEQIQTIDKTDLINRLGKANDMVMQSVDKALMTSGGIEIDRLISEKPIFNLQKAKEYVEGLSNIDKYILEPNNINIEGLLISRRILLTNLKEYCYGYNIEYSKFYNDRLMNTYINNAIYNKGDVKVGISI